jgi:tetratricopeptide (TPR) repeat protein
MQHYQAACALDPDQPEGHYNLANLFEEDGDLEMAIAEHRRALGCNPDFADAHFNLAVVLERAGSDQQALEHWQRFLQLCPDGPDEEPWRELARQRVEALRPE